MTTTTVPPAEAAATVRTWLSAFSDALASNDATEAAALFTEDCYWRDLIAFTWNIRTVEGTRGDHRHAREKLTASSPAAADHRRRGTRRGRRRDRGVDRVRDRRRARARATAAPRRQGWTLLTTLNELKGLRGAQGQRRPKGAEHGANRGSEDLAGRARARGRRSWAYTEQPYVVIVGGGQGGIALGARLRQLGVPTIIVDKQRAGRATVAQPLQVALPARPGLVRPHAVPGVPRQLAGVLAEGQDRRLARDRTRRSWS